MQARNVFIGMLIIAALSACGQNQEQTTSPTAGTVPTSPNAAVQTTVPEIGTETAPTEITQVANEEITVSPVTITVGPETTATP